jgi:phospholipase/carboxylesterase
VHESAEALRAIGGQVTTVLYPGMDHTITREEIDEVTRLIAPLAASEQQP